MKVMVLSTWENPKSDEGLKKYYEHGEKYGKYLDERRKKFNVKNSVWADGTGKIYWMMEFESYDSYAKFMDDKEYQKIQTIGWRTVKNAKIRVLRESIYAQP